MASKYHLTNEAAADLEAIYSYSIESFGLPQAKKYLRQFHDLFDLLADNPRLGRDCSYIKEGYRKHEHRKHTTYYKITDQGILIARVLGEKQNQERHLM